MKKDRLPTYIKNREKLNFKVPSLFNNDSIMFNLLSVCDLYGIKIPISQVYGSIKNSWNSGRMSKIREFDEQYARDIIKKYNKFGIGVAFTFTKYNITEDMLDDKVANTMLNIASEEDFNYAIVSSDLLVDYIRAEYPNIKLESSLLKPTYEYKDYSEKPSYYDELAKKFDKVMIRPEFGQDYKYLKQIKNKAKIDILINSNCVYKCPYSIAHYDRANMLENEEIPLNTIMCNSRVYDKVSLQQNNLLSNDYIDKLIKLGYINYKIAGRNINPLSLLYLLGTYIFDGSGVYAHILNVLPFKSKMFTE